MYEQVQKIADTDRSQRLKLIQVKEKERTNRSQVKYNSRHDLELARMEHERREAERQREHQIVMLRTQMEMYRAAPGAPPFAPHNQGGPFPAGPMFGGGPAFGAPPPLGQLFGGGPPQHGVYDPSL